MANQKMCKCGKHAHFLYGDRCENCFVNDVSHSGPEPYRETQSELSEDMPREEQLSFPVSELGLETRIANALEKMGVVTIGDLVTVSHEYFLSTPNLGKRALACVRRNLQFLGLDLRSGT